MLVVCLFLLGCLFLDLNCPKDDRRPDYPSKPGPEVLVDENRVVKSHYVENDDTIWAPTHGKTKYYLLMDNPRSAIDPKYRRHKVTVVGRVFKDNRHGMTLLNKVKSNEMTNVEAMALRNKMVALARPGCPPKLATEFSRMINARVGHVVKL